MKQEDWEKAIEPFIDIAEKKKSDVLLADQYVMKNRLIRRYLHKRVNGRTRVDQRVEVEENNQ